MGILYQYIFLISPINQFDFRHSTGSQVHLIGFILAERETRAEEEIPLLTTSIKADVDVKMGIVSDVKLELRKAQAYKINYSTRKLEK